MTVLGTRPEIIKLSPLIPLLDNEFEHLVVHTGQHYSWEMDALFFQELKLRAPNYNLNAGSGNHGEQTGKIMKELEKVMLAEKPDLLLVLGDTNSTLAGALVGSKLGCRVIHLEAGCRSKNRYQPEEINRIVADHCADFLLTIDKESTHNLLKEGFDPQRIFFVGNIVEDACFRALHLNLHLKENSNLLQQVTPRSTFSSSFPLPSERNLPLVLATIHRAENTDHPERLRNIVEALQQISQHAQVIFPLHPRTRKVLQEQHLLPAILSSKIRVEEPQGYLAFVSLLAQASAVITDSGGVLEEAAFLGVPAIIPREKTELHEFVEQGKAILVGTEKETIVQATQQQISQRKEKKELKDPAISQKIMEVLKTI